MLAAPLWLFATLSLALTDALSLVVSCDVERLSDLESEALSVVLCEPLSDMLKEAESLVWLSAPVESLLDPKLTVLASAKF